MSEEKWFFEKYQDSLSMGFKYKKTLFEGKSQFQTVKIIETTGHGNMLINDGIIMTCDRDEFIYHEMISHVPMFSHPNPKHVLIIGGGDGGTAREVLKHKAVKKCTMIEIDEMVVKACRQYLPNISQSLDHPLLDLKFEDGASYIANKSNEFDIVIVDSSDPIGPSAILFGDEFYKNVYEALKEDGIVVAQAESSFYEMEVQKRLLKTVYKKFSKSGFYNYSNLSYPNGAWSFLFASKKYHPIQDFSKQRLSQSGIKFRYYNSHIHKSSFSQAQFIKEALSDVWTL